MSTLSAFPFIGEQSFATPGAINSPLSIISANIAAINTDVGALSGVTISPPSGNTIQMPSDLSISGFLSVGKGASIGTVGPSVPQPVGLTINVNSGISDYIHFNDTSNLRSGYLIGSHAGGTADGLNIFDVSGNTMIASFSKQSIRFYQNVVGPVFDVGGALASTLNAATFAGSNITTQIQAAIIQASQQGLARVYTPASMHSYDASTISFIYTVQMVREGGDWSVFDAYAYGAAANSTGNDWFALTAAISAASVAGGGVVFMPDGTYSISSGIVMDATQTNSIGFIGRGRRDVIIRPALSVRTAIQVGNVGKKTFYGSLRDFTISAPSGHTGCGMWLQQPSYFNVERINIESFTSGTGLDVRGAAVSTGSEAVRNLFSQVLVATCQRPAYLQNVDENEWYSCIFGANPGATSAITALEINQGRSNRFYGLLLAGDSSSVRTNYTGVLLSAPVQPGGDNAGNTFYGVVSEGFNQGFWISSAVVNNTAILFHSSSINSSGISDSGQNTLYLESGNLGNPFLQWPAGVANAPGFAFRSEASMGWYWPGTGRMALSKGALEVPGTPFSANNPTVTFSSNRSAGLVDNAGPGMDLVVAGTVPGRLLTGQWQFLAGSSVLPGLASQSEASLGFYRSAASVMALSYGQLAAPSTPFSLNLPTFAFVSARSTGLLDNAGPGLDIAVAGTLAGRALANQWLTGGSGSAILPPLGFGSDISLGFFRSGVSTVALSYGTFNLATQGVRLSMRTIAASALTASAANTNVAVNEVVFTISASGASYAINSGGTTWIFNSDASAKNT